MAAVAPEIVFPLTFHWKPGVVPPLVGVAVKVTDVPAQTGFEDAAMLILAETFGFTVIVTELDVAGLPLTHAASEVIIQLITSPLARTAFE